MWVGGLHLRRKRTVALPNLVTVASDRAGGGARYQDGTAVVAVQVVRKIHTPNGFTGSASTHVENTIDVQTLYGLLHQSLDLTIDSMSVVIAGAWRRSTGDYAGPRHHHRATTVRRSAGRPGSSPVSKTSTTATRSTGDRRRVDGGRGGPAHHRRAADERGSARVRDVDRHRGMERRLGSSALRPTDSSGVRSGVNRAS